MTRRAIAALLLAVLALLPASRLRAAGPLSWRLEGAAAFLEGDLSGLSLDSRGRLRLGPDPRLLADPVAPNGWALARDSKGALYVGTGNQGRLVRLDGASSSTFFDFEQLEVNAVAIGPDGRMFAATSPDGAVYSFDAAGRATEFFNPKQKYIWALAFDAAGSLYVATGGEARVYRVAADGKATAILTSTDSHILSLALDPRGRLYAGSAPQGIVYRVDARGEVSVVLDAPFREIRALAASPDGTLYAAAVDGRPAEPVQRSVQPAAPATPAAATVVPEVTVTETVAVLTPAGGAPLAVQPAAEAAAAQPKGAVLRLTEAGDVDTLWTSTEDVPHSILYANGAVLVGTGNKGKLYRITNDGDWTLLATLAAEQITALAHGPDEEALALTSNPARVYSLQRGLAARGRFLSKVKDAEVAARWGRVFWEGATPTGTTVETQVRTGNTDRPDATWTDWSAPSVDRTGPSIRADRSRFLQVRVSLLGRDGLTPTVEAVSASYLQRNLPPSLQTITVHPPGEVFQKPPSMSGEPEILGAVPETVVNRGAETVVPATSPAVFFGRKMFQRGFRTVSWQATDPNGDPLTYDLLYRPVGDERWRPLRRGLSDPVFAWDTLDMPNGRYLVRVIASDAGGNPPALALTATKDSRSFEVDNTPPIITASVDQSNGTRLQVTVRDDSPIRKLEFSLDGRPWQEVHPTDGIADSPEERYEILVPPGSSSPVVVLRAADILGNTATLRARVP